MNTFSLTTSKRTLHLVCRQVLFQQNLCFWSDKYWLFTCFPCHVYCFPIWKFLLQKISRKKKKNHKNLKQTVIVKRMKKKKKLLETFKMQMKRKINGMLKSSQKIKKSPVHHKTPPVTSESICPLNSNCLQKK